MMQRFQVLRVAVTALCFAVAAAPALAQGTAPAGIVAFGDSLSAGYGVGPGEGFPEQLQAALQGRGYAVAVANAGVSGDTTTGGRERLEWSVPATARLVILELGANDMLRGTDPAVTRKALDTILRRLADRRIPVLLAGMKASRNLGPSYVERFDAIYPDLAREYGLVLYPFFLDGVAGERSLNQADGMHPTKEGVARIVERMLPTVEAQLEALGVRPGRPG